MFAFLKRLFRRKGYTLVTAPERDLRTADGISIDDIREGDVLRWTDSDGRENSGVVMVRAGVKMVQAGPCRSVTLYSIIDRATIEN